MDEEFGNTQPLEEQLECVSIEPENYSVEHLSYGLLTGYNMNIEPVDLHCEEFIAGRCFSCDLDLRKIFLSRGCYAEVDHLSKKHFTLSKDLRDRSSPTYITDNSLNGTYVNGKLMGRNKTRILKNKDVISLFFGKYGFVYEEFYCIVPEELIGCEYVDQYHVGRLLGSGCFGLVYHVHDIHSCEQYALKIVKRAIHLNDARSSTASDMLEPNIMSNVNHPCLINMISMIEKPDAILMIMDYMAGGDLLTRILHTQFLQEPTSKFYFFQLCEAVKYLHENGIVHRDIKPDNILLRDAAELTLLKLSDFGSSKFVAQDTFLRTICGTPQYVAPEVLKNGTNGYYTSKVDVWSLGVVLYTMLSGLMPFCRSDGWIEVEDIKRGAFSLDHPVWFQVSLEAKHFIYEILNVNPDRRPSIGMLLQSQWLNDEDIVRYAFAIMNG